MSKRYLCFFSVRRSTYSASFSLPRGEQQHNGLPYLLVPAHGPLKLPPKPLNLTIPLLICLLSQLDVLAVRIRLKDLFNLDQS